MPDPRRLYRRITDSNLPTRVIAHISVVSLVVAASAASYAGAQGHDGAGPSSDPGFLSLVSSVRGAAEQPGQAPLSTSYDLDALSEEQSTMLDRAAPAGIPGDAPMPTPVPVDPDATPLAAPTNGIGSTGASGVGGLSNRSSAPSSGRGLYWPVPGGSISQYYHAGHLALDIAAPYGAQVAAAQGGRKSVV